MSSRVDLVVIGGGPVGLVSALYAVRAGQQVVVLEPRAGVVDKACGEGLMPGALAALTDLGVDPPGHPLTGITYTDDRHRVTAGFGPLVGRGVRRTALHQCLLAAVAREGVEIREHAMTSIGQDEHTVIIGAGAGAGLRAGYAIAADGLHSPTRRALGLLRAERPGARRPRRYGLRQHVRCRPWTDTVEVHWAPDAEAYVTPVDKDFVGVALLTGSPTSWPQLLERFPALRDRLGDAPPVSRLRGAGPLRQRASSRVAGRVLLVGDAGGYVDALTGEGLSVGFAQARVAVQAITAQTPERYPGLARSVSWRSSALTTALLAATGPSWARQRLVPAAARLQAVFRWTVGELALPR